MNPPKLLASVGAGASLVVKSSPGILFKVQIYNNNAAVRYLHIFNSASLAANGASPDIPPYSLPATGAASQPTVVDFGNDGVRFTNGIVVANSTTQTTLTLGSADSAIAVTYI